MMGLLLLRSEFDLARCAACNQQLRRAYLLLKRLISFAKTPEAIGMMGEGGCHLPPLR